MIEGIEIININEKFPDGFKFHILHKKSGKIIASFKTDECFTAFDNHLFDVWRKKNIDLNDFMYIITKL